MFDNTIDLDKNMIEFRSRNWYIQGLQGFVYWTWKTGRVVPSCEIIQDLGGSADLSEWLWPYHDHIMFSDEDQ